MNQTFYCSHQLSKVAWCLKTNMSSAIALVVLPLLLQSVQATFPPVVNPPPIPSQAVRTVDYDRFFINGGDLIPNQPSNVIKDEGYYQVDEKQLDQKLYAPENQSGETGAFVNADYTFDRYSEDQPYIGPVATPLPDDTYVAQQSVTSKVLPESPANIGSSDMWVLTKGPDNQYIRERWVQLPIQQDRVVEVVNADVPPKQYTETVKAFPPVAQPPPVPIKAPVAAPPNIIQQVWVRAPQPIQAQRFIQNPPTVVEEIPSVKQIVDIPSPPVKQYIQPQIVKEALPLPPPPPPSPPTITKKSSGFIVPPPPPPPLKVTDYASPKQSVVINQPSFPVEQVVVEKSAPLPQVKHIWVPTSQNTGKFITVPVGTVVDGGKSIPSKGIPLDVPPPPPPPPSAISVSDTWVLKQDGPIPRFEEQKSIGPVAPVIQKGSVFIDAGPKVQFDSPKNPPLVGKSIDTAVPVNIWPAKNPIPQQKVIVAPAPAPPPPAISLPPPPVKSDAIVVGKSVPIAPPPKTIFSGVKGMPQLPPPPPPSIVAPLPQVINGKPCPLPLAPVKSQFPPQPVPVPAYRTIAINRPPFGRILRINRYPYGPYYVLNPRVGSNFYTYPRAPIAPVIQQTKSGQVVRLIPARSLAVPVAPRQVAVPVSPKQVPVPPKQLAVPVAPKQFAVPAPRKQIVVPFTNGKSAAPVLLYPPVNRIRFAYPWGSYIRSLPVAGKNIFVLPPNNKPAKVKAEKSSSSESSSSESSSSESKSSEKKSKAKEVKKSSEEEEKEEEVAESVESIESEEPEIEKAPEPVVEEEEAAASEAEPEETAAPTVEEPETKEESIEVEESQVKPQLLNRGFIDPNTNNFDVLTKPFFYGFDQREISGRKETSDTDGRVIGSYNFRQPDGIFKNVAYVSDSNGYRAHVVSNDPGTTSYQRTNTNYIANATPENITHRVPDIETAASHENLTEDPQRD